MRQRLHRLLNSPWLTPVNALLCVGAIVANLHHQVFCRPVPWVVVVLAIAFAPVILVPLFRQRLQRLTTPILFLFGVAGCICVYCILFLAEMNLIGLAFILGIMWALPLTYVPHFFLLQILYFTFRVPSIRPFRKFFFAGIGLCAVFAITMALWFSSHYNAVRLALSTGDASNVPRDYMTEKMLGMHFKYHLSFCSYDGWRPPLHDPSVVVAIWINAPFRSDMDYRGMGMSPIRTRTGIPRIAVYHAVFPELPIQLECSCAKAYQKMYLNDPVFR